MALGKTGREIGCRVGAMRSRDAKKAYIFGYGTYEGDFMDGPMKGMANPKLKLDNGDIVWGCECWWGSEENMKKELGDVEVEIVPVPIRK